MTDRLRVADFFCGAGGFSEGFRQAGFEICFAVDKWGPAINTYKANTAHAVVADYDVVALSRLPDVEFNKIIPDTEVIIGSPPCVAFSNSNRSGNGEKELGIELFTSYLRIIARKMQKKDSILKYWILENVPNIKLQEHLKDFYSAEELGLSDSGDFALDTQGKASGIYNVKHYGAPTNRTRYICGNFPRPKKTKNDKDLVTLGDVLKSLERPPNKDDMIIDCNYPDLSLKYSDITDHNYECILEDFEWETAERLKRDRGYMGKMSFPENLDKPSRTVMATMSTSSRESMILGTEEEEVYRLPTVREVACMMSFPNDYRFYGTTKGTKYTLVGNAVPPKFSYALAKAIMEEEDREVPSKYEPIKYDPMIEFINLNGRIFDRKKEKRKRDIARFKYHIPYLILSSYRVELTNYCSDFANKKFKWTTEIHYSQGKDHAKIFVPASMKILDSDMKEKVNNYIRAVEKDIVSFNEFQNIFCMTKEQRRSKPAGPFELLKSIRGFIDETVIDDYVIRTEVLDGMEDPIPYAIALGYTILSEILEKMEKKMK